MVVYLAQVPYKAYLLMKALQAMGAATDALIVNVSRQEFFAFSSKFFYDDNAVIIILCDVFQ